MDDVATRAVIEQNIRMRMGADLALLLLEGESDELHFSGYHRRRRVPKVTPLTAVQRGRLAAAILERAR